MKPERAISETISVILIIALMLIITLIIFAYFTGTASLLQKSAYIAQKADDVNTSVNAHVISLFHQEGDQVVLSPLGSGNRIPVSFLLISPNGTSHAVTRSSLTVDPVWQSGKTLYFYRNASGYFVIDNLSARIPAITTTGPLVDLERGTWTVKTIDDNVHVVINSVPIYVGGSGSASVSPYTPGLIATYYSDRGWTVPVVSKIVNQIHFADAASGRASDVNNWPVSYLGKADQFSVKFDGLLKIDTEDDYTFTLSSDDGSYMDLGGTSNFISNGGDHAFASVSNTKHLKPGYYPITVPMYENGGAAVVYLDYKTPSMSSSQLVTNLWHVPSTAPFTDFTGFPRAGPAPLAVQFTDASTDAQSWSWNFGDGSALSTAKNPVHTYTTMGTYPVTLTATNTFGSSTAAKAGYITAGSFAPGFRASYYYDEGWSALAGTPWTDAQIHFTDQAGSTWPIDRVNKQENFSVTWDGYFNVPAEADYAFRLTSDDGSWLWVDETLLIDNGGLHGSTAVTRTVHLTPGYHHLVVNMYEHTGVAVAYLDYALPPSTSYLPVTDVYRIP